MTSGEAWLDYGDIEAFGWDDVGVFILVIAGLIWYCRHGYRYFQ